MATHDTLQSEIVAWATKTFPDSTFDAVAAHLDEEWGELEELLHYPPDVVKPMFVKRVAEEVADVMHLLFQVADLYGFDVLVETREKFEINQMRTWGDPDPETGVVKHVTEDDHDDNR